MGYLIEQKLNFIHYFDCRTGIGQNEVDFVTQILHLTLMICICRISEIVVIQISRLSRDHFRWQLVGCHMHDMLCPISKQVVYFGTSQNQSNSIVVVKLKDLNQKEIDEIQLQFGKSNAKNKVRRGYQQHPCVYALHGNRQFAVLVSLEKDFVGDWQLRCLHVQKRLLQQGQLTFDSVFHRIQP